MHAGDLLVVISGTLSTICKGVKKEGLVRGRRQTAAQWQQRLQQIQAELELGVPLTEGALL